MKRWLWVLFAISISSSVYMTIRYGLRPKPVPVMNPTEFENLEQIGVVTYKRLLQNIRPERIIILGSSPELAGSEEVWSGFLKAALNDRLKIDAFYQFEGLPAPHALQGIELQPFTEAQIQSGEFSQTVKNRLRAGHLVIVHGPTRRVSHLIKDSLSRQLDEVVHHPVLAISTLPTTIESESLKSMQESCQNLQSSNAEDARLACSIARVSRAMIRKHLDQNKIWAVMERHGLQEYLLFVHRE